MLFFDREYLIQSQFKCVILIKIDVTQHPGEKDFQNATALLNARIGIDLNQIHLLIPVHNIVKPVDLKTELSIVLIQLVPDALHGMHDSLPYRVLNRPLKLLVRLAHILLLKYYPQHRHSKSPLKFQT